MSSLSSPLTQWPDPPVIEPTEGSVTMYREMDMRFYLERAEAEMRALV